MGFIWQQVEDDLPFFELTKQRLGKKNINISMEYIFPIFDT